MSERVFAVLGATGNVGKALVRKLVDDSSVTSVLLIGRREVCDIILVSHTKNERLLSID